MRGRAATVLAYVTVILDTQVVEVPVFRMADMVDDELVPGYAREVGRDASVM